jgi:cytosine/creatinine deaminase
MTDIFMQKAIEEAKAAQASGGYPYGAALVQNNELVSTGRNRMIENNDPTSHAEIEALRAAGLRETFTDTVMYASAFPCLMCAGAMVMLGVPKVVVGASWTGCGSSQAFLQANGVEIVVLELEECQALLASDK